MAHFISNTDKTYPCVQCGSESANIVREGVDPRMKCTRCNFMYNASDSIAAKEAGEIPNEAAYTPPAEPEPDTNPRRPREEPTRDAANSTPSRVREAATVPRSPSYVFISKTRDRTEFATKKNVKQIAMRWQYEGVKFDLFELQPKAVSAKVDIT